MIGRRDLLGPVRRWIGRVDSPPEARAPGEPTAVNIDLVTTLAYFDPAFYARQAGLDALETRRAAEHYLGFGEAAGLSPHPLFDPAYYLRTNPDVAGSGWNALLHYRAYGRFENRNPHPLFDTRFARSQLADPAADPLDSYIASAGRSLQPHPFVDRRFIRAQMPPGSGSISELEHLLAHHPAPDPNVGFDGSRYAAAYPDLGEANPARHYVEFGRSEGRAAFHTLLRRDLDGVIEAAARLDAEILAGQTDRDIPLVGMLALPRWEFDYVQTALGARATARRGIVVVASHVEAVDSPDPTSRLMHDLAEIVRPATGLAIMVTDRASDPGGISRLRDLGCHVADLAATARSVGSAPRARAIAQALQSVLPASIVIANSQVGWALVHRHGRALSMFTRLVAFAPPFRDGSGLGWAVMRRGADSVRAVLTPDRTAALRAVHAGWLPPHAVEKCLPFDVSSAGDDDRRNPGPRRPVVLSLGSPPDERARIALGSLGSRLPDVEFLGEMPTEPKRAAEGVDIVLLVEPSTAALARLVADAAGRPVVALTIVASVDDAPTPRSGPLASRLLQHARELGFHPVAFEPSLARPPEPARAGLAERLVEAGVLQGPFS